MPIYEYYSPETHTVYSFYARGVRSEVILLRCPDGPAHTMKRIISGFSITGNVKPDEGTDGHAVDDPEVFNEMSEIENELSRMDESNPDPRQLGALMRKMGALSGESLSEQMSELIGRLESGEDPESLEAEIENLPELDELDSVPEHMKRLSLRKRQGAPKKDETLYDFDEFVT